MLENCPQCGYSLRGLPENHRCPECGQAYDRDSAIFFRGRSRRQVITDVLLVLGMLFGAVYHWRTFVVQVPAGASFLSFLVALLWSVPVVVLGYHLWHLHRHRRLVAVMPDVLWIRMKGATNVRVPWENVSRVAAKLQLRGMLGAVIILQMQQEVREQVGPFRSREEAERFVELAQRRIEAAAGGSAQRRH